jgi:hypothetical protein
MGACSRATIANGGETINQSINNEFTALTTLSLDNIPLFKRDRSYTYTYDFNLSADNGTCDGALPGLDTTVVSNISDNWIGIDTEIIYLDPRYNHVVYKEHTVLISYNAPMTTFNSYVHYTFYDNMPIIITKITRTVSNIYGELERTEETETKIVNLCVNLGGTGHVLSRYVDSKYYSWNLYVESILDFSNPERDGFAWSYPNYIHGLFFNTSSDLDYRQALEETWYSSEPITTNYTPAILSDNYPQGSWAVDRDGNMFCSQMLENGVFNLLKSASGEIGDPTILTELEGDNPVFYPIAPV